MRGRCGVAYFGNFKQMLCLCVNITCLTKALLTTGDSRFKT